MIRGLKEKFLSENEMYLGERKVKIQKITPAKWKELFRVVDSLPGLIIQLFATPKKDFYATVIQALDLALDEIVLVVSTLSGVEKKYIEDHAGLDEIIEYLTKLVKVNRLDTTIKNVKSLLPKKE